MLHLDRREALHARDESGHYSEAESDQGKNEAAGSGNCRLGHHNRPARDGKGQQILEGPIRVFASERPAHDRAKADDPEHAAEHKDDILQIDRPITLTCANNSHEQKECQNANEDIGTI
ncbi:hypothetical protein D3C71_1331540 [compost metagenome]